jgi:RED-like protein N-terminal region
MDNSQFRNLLKDDKRKAGSGSAVGPGSSSQAFKIPALGSRARSSIPMTPRSVAGYKSTNDFARQVAEQKRLADGEPPTKKFRSSAAPKGTKLKQGYQDRTVLRRAGEEHENLQDDKEKRLQALEEMLKLQQIDQATFERLKSAIGVGGDVSSTHLVKGLDWKLLERVRRGDDISKTEQHEDTEESTAVDFDNELDSVLAKEVRTADKSAQNSHQSKANVSESTSTPIMSRDEILRRLKAGRTTASLPPPPPVEPALGDRFKRVGSASKAEKKRFVETVRGRRREVLLTTDKDGNVKRKVRWLDKEATNETEKQPLGMEVPAEIAAKQKALLEQQQIQEDDDDDTFVGVGADYNPLAGLGDDSDGDSRSDGDIITETMKQGTEPEVNQPLPAKSRRNYFNTEDPVDDSNQTAPMTNDPTILAALKKAAALRQSQGQDEPGGDDDRNILADDNDPERALRHKLFLEKLKQRDRDDARDLDMGFGESRFGDDDDEEGPLWGDGDEAKGSGRKRGPKKRKGNKDNVGDVMRVIEGRKKAGP